jgi:hypothetical protein
VTPLDWVIAIAFYAALVLVTVSGLDKYRARRRR